MPADFDACVRNNGRVRTISGPNKQYGLGKNEYCHVCFDKKGMHMGEKKTKEKETKK